MVFCIQDSIEQVTDLCPSCGEFNHLREDTGFCNDCSPGDFCDTCGNLFSPDQQTRTTCSTCRYERWLAKHADRLEEFIAEGLTFSEAKKKVREQSKTICISCGTPLAQHRGRLCTTNKKCKSVRVRTRYNVTVKGMSKEEALREALQRVHGRLTVFYVST